MLDRFSVIRNRRSLECNRVWSGFWWTQGMHMMPPPAVAKQKHLKRILKARGHKVFIESGTYQGATTAYMARHAEHVYTVELGEFLAAKAQARFINNTCVTVVHGDSTEEIPKLVANCTTPPLIFLDGHYSAKDTVQGDEIEPAPTILQALGSVAPAGSTIVVDDLRILGTAEGFPQLDVPVIAAREAFPQAVIRAGLDSIVIEL